MLPINSPSRFDTNKIRNFSKSRWDLEKNFKMQNANFKMQDNIFLKFSFCNLQFALPTRKPHGF
jgi:hypothetical protein